MTRGTPVETLPRDAWLAEESMRKLLAALRSVPSGPPFEGVRLERGWRRLQGLPGPSPAKRWRMVIVAALGVLATGSVAAAARRTGWLPEWRPRATRATSVARSVPAPLAERPASLPERPIPPPEPETAAPPNEALVPEAPAPVRPPRPARARAAPRPAGATAPESALAKEARLLARAVAALRQGRDADAALGLLEEHHQRFPRGAFSSEAQVARVDALLALGRKREALAALDALPLERLPRATELRLFRGELRANAHRCAAAEPDFDKVLAAAESVPDVTERALYGRAICRSETGDGRQAAEDFTAYLRRFPTGRFASQARAALGHRR